MFPRYLPTFWLAFSLIFGACAPQPPAAQDQPLQVLAAESFLADIAQNVAGDRLQVHSLIPPGVDLHAFEPSPQDMRSIEQSQVLILNGGGLETWAASLLQNTSSQQLIIEAAAGLTPRQIGASELVDEETDPHFWLDPLLVIHYVENIRDGLSAADPQGSAIYQQNAAAYIEKLKTLDTWITHQVSQIEPTRRLLLTEHETLGYFADRYGFSIVGAILPSVSGGASTSSKELASLVEIIRARQAPAIFLEAGGNSPIARQLAQETGIKIVDTLYTHSLSDAQGPAPTYLKMMEFNVNAMVTALQ